MFVQLMPLDFEVTLKLELGLIGAGVCSGACGPRTPVTFRACVFH